MEKRRLGTIEVSPIGMGCMGLSHGYGDIPSEEYSIEAIRKAYDFGCTFFDTAEAYGPNMLRENRGHNERIVGKALKDVRQKVVIATKLHLPASETKELDVYAAIRQHLEVSLKRLQTDYADLYYWHRVNRDLDLEEVAAAFGRLIKDGLIRGWGLSQVGAETIRRAHAVTPLSAVQNIYSMVERDCETEIFPYAVEHGIGVVPFSPIASGLLSGRVTTATDFSHSDDVRKYVPQLTRENLTANEPLLRLLRDYAVRKQATMAQVSLAWMLHKYPNVVPIPGSRNQERILENLGGWNIALTAEEFAELEQTLDSIEIHGHRGIVEFEGGTMADWGKNK